MLVLNVLFLASKPLLLELSFGLRDFSIHFIELLLENGRRV